MQAFRSPALRRPALRWLVGIAVIPLVVAGCGGGGSSNTGAPSADNVITIETTTMTVTGGHWRELVALEKGFFKDEGLNVKESTVSPQISIDALLSGSAKIGLGDPTKLVQSVDAGAKLVIVGQGVDRSGNSFMAKKGDDTIADLKGATIGLANQVDPYNGIVEEFLKKGGLSASDVNFVYGQGSSDRAAALQGGAIDATLVPPPTDSKLAAKGYAVLGKTIDVAPLLARSSIIANRDWAADNAEVITAYLRALNTAEKWLYDPANKDEAIAMLAKDNNASAEETAPAYKEYVESKEWDAKGCVNAEAIKELLDRLDELDAAKSTDVDSYSTTEYCP